MVEGGRALNIALIVRGRVPPPLPPNSAVAEFDAHTCPSRASPTWVAVPLPRYAGEEFGGAVPPHFFAVTCCRHEYFGSYPSTRRAFSIEISESFLP